MRTRSKRSPCLIECLGSSLVLAKQHAIMIAHACESSVVFFLGYGYFKICPSGGWWYPIQSRENGNQKSRPPHRFCPSSAIFARRCSYPMLARFSESAAELGPISRCKTAKRCCAVCKHVHFCNVVLTWTKAFLPSYTAVSFCRS